MKTKNIKTYNKIWIRKFSIRKKHQRKDKVYNEFVYQNRKNIFYKGFDSESNNLFQNGIYVVYNKSKEREEGREDYRVPLYE